MIYVHPDALVMVSVMAELTKEQIQDYIERGGTRCPSCKSENITGTSRCEVDCGICTQNVHCDDCGLTWDDVYKLVNIYQQPQGRILKLV